METDIILKGFLQSEQQHGLRYTRFIRDGDSSVYPALVSDFSYRPFIKKLECANHAVKCYHTALENLVHDKPSYKGRGKLTETVRKKLTKAARSAILMRSQEADKVQAVKNSGETYKTAHYIALAVIQIAALITANLFRNNNNNNNKISNNSKISNNKISNNNIAIVKVTLLKRLLWWVP